MTQKEEYRKRGVKWSPDEFPLKKARPKLKKTRPELYVYDCEDCGNEFTSSIEIHIPYCCPCRIKNFNKLVTHMRFRMGRS